ncbi:unnamed protein product [Caenorhabditis auriculariae]|uniref:Uncharacterized protein n=1 Tax=Caenorhabditis auriculariae TaxID=2777116 RepID=A0A8S1HDZ3_9PELO|nr:unnamed protein product [Caenorhabditis auriculariae]
MSALQWVQGESFNDTLAIACGLILLGEDVKVSIDRICTFTIRPHLFFLLVVAVVTFKHCLTLQYTEKFLRSSVQFQQDWLLEHRKMEKVFHIPIDFRTERNQLIRSYESKKSGSRKSKEVNSMPLSRDELLKFSPLIKVHLVPFCVLVLSMCMTMAALSVGLGMRFSNPVATWHYNNGGFELLVSTLEAHAYQFANTVEMRRCEGSPNKVLESFGRATSLAPLFFTSTLTVASVISDVVISVATYAILLLILFEGVLGSFADVKSPSSGAHFIMYYSTVRYIYLFIIYSFLLFAVLSFERLQIC